MARLFLTFLACVALIPAADAAKPSKALKSVKACSRYGNGCMTVPIRQTSLGLQAQLKSGTWIYCRGDCADTVREDVLDFWETLQPAGR